MSCKVLFFETRIGLSRGKSAMCGGSFALAVWHYSYVGMWCAVVCGVAVSSVVKRCSVWCCGAQCRDDVIRVGFV